MTSRPLGTVSPVPEVRANPAVQRLLAALAQRGITPTPTGPSAIGFLDDAPGQAYTIGVPEETTGGYLYIHVYPDTTAVAATIAHLPTTIVRDGVPTWANTPHFFHYETSIILLLSQDPLLVHGFADAGAIPFAWDALPVAAPSASPEPEQPTPQRP